jgi:hypothetical protein
VTRRAGRLIAVCAAGALALVLVLSFGGRGAAQTTAGAQPDVIQTVRVIKDRKAGEFGQSVEAEPGTLVQFYVRVRNYQEVEGQAMKIDVDRGPGRSLVSAAGGEGGTPQRVTVRGAGGKKIALGVLRFNCVAPPTTFCPVRFKPGDARWRGSYALPRSRLGAIFTATVVEPSEQP